MVSTSQKRTLDNDRIAQAIADTPRSIIARDVCNAADNLAKCLGAAAIASTDGIPCSFTPSTADVSAATEHLDYDAHIAGHDSRISSVVSKTSGASGNNWKEAGPCHE